MEGQHRWYLRVLGPLWQTYCGCGWESRPGTQLEALRAGDAHEVAIPLHEQTVEV